MTKDDLLKLIKMYVTISDEYIQKFPDESTWKKHEDVDFSYIATWKREGKLELLKELMGMFEHGE